MQLIHQTNSFLNDRGFKSLHCQRRSDSGLQKKRNTGVTNQLHDNGVRRLVAALCLRAFLDRLTYGTNSRHRCEKAQLETLPELESFIQHDAPRFWEAIGLNFVSGDWLLRRCRQRENSISMRWYQTEGGA
jgi:hypothetical protein